MSDAATSIIIVGAGPTGLFLALRLAQAGVQFTIIEAKPGLEDSTKALTHMPTIFPEYSKAGLLEDVLTAAGELRSTGALFRKSNDKSVISQMPNVPGRPGPCIIPQGKFAKILLKKVLQHEYQQVHFDCTFESFQETDSGGVSVLVRKADGQQSTIKAHYLIAADGGKSPVRKCAGISFEGETLSYQLVATDLRYPFEQFGWDPLMANFLAGENYGLVTPIDDNGLWRCSFGIPLDDGATPSIEQIQAAIPTKFESMLPSAPGGKARGWELVNVAPYKAQQLCAQTMCKGPVILIGDSAHLTNPYAGMGLNTGIFDAASLADVLICILQRNGAAGSLLNGWATARKTVYTKIVDPVSRAAFAAMRDPDVDSLPERHPMLKAMKMQGAKPPDLMTDVSKLEGWVA